MVMPPIVMPPVVIDEEAGVEDAPPELPPEQAVSVKWMRPAPRREATMILDEFFIL